MGRLSLSYNDLFYYSLDDLDLMLEGKDYELKQMWEAARLAGHLALMPNLKPHAQKDPKRHWQFAWEQNSSNANPITDDDFDKFSELHKKIKDGKVTS